MTMDRTLIVAALMALCAGPASAGLFRVGDLGAMASRQICITAAASLRLSFLFCS